MHRCNLYEVIELPVSVRFAKGEKLGVVRIQQGSRETFLEIPTFLRADGSHAFRFSASKPGVYTVLETNDRIKVSAGLHTGTSNLARRGPPKISTNGRYVCYSDGTPFFWLADTWWYGGSRRMTLKNLTTLCKDRAKKGFSAVLLVAGVPPETDPFSPEAASSYGPSFNKDGGINSAYFDDFDKKIQLIVKNGIVPCIVGSWGYHIDLFGVETMKTLWREIIARYASYPVTFCLTGEVDGFLRPLPWMLMSLRAVVLRLPLQNLLRFIYRLAACGESVILKKRLSNWQTVGQYIESLDPFHRICLVHPQRKVQTKDLFPHQSFLDIDSIQSGHTEENRGFIVTAARAAYQNHRPFINLEPWYEGILGNFGPRHQRYAFWMSLLSGACGHTYGAHGVWQMANGDNFMAHWGNSSWEKAMKHNGSAQLGAAASFIRHFPWWTLRPEPHFFTPQWDSDHPYRPIAAKDEKGIIWVYVPGFPTDREDKAWRKQLSVYNGAHIRWIDPVSMKTIQEPKTLKDKDCLILLGV